MRSFRRPFIVARFPLLVVVAWLTLVVGTAAFPGRLASAVAQRPAATLPASAESSRVAAETDGGRRTTGLPVVLVWEARERSGQGGHQPGRLSAHTARRALASLSPSVGLPGPVTATDSGGALACVITLATPDSTQLPVLLRRIRAVAERVPAARVHIAGPAAQQADLQASFQGIDHTLLAITLCAVAVILLLVYRSVVMPVVVIASGVGALTLCSAALYLVQTWGVVRIDGQAQGILSVLVIGATTDYALLLLSRYREVVSTMPVKDAMRAAWSSSWAPITASGATVACAMAALLFSSAPSNHSLAPAGALAMGCSVLAALTFVPCAALAAPRALFWPRDSRPDRSSGRLWSLAAAAIDRHSRPVWLLGSALLAGCAALAILLSPQGLPLGSALAPTAPSVTAQAALAAHFPAGTGSPAIVLVPSSRSAQARKLVAATPGVAQAEAAPGLAKSAHREAILATFDSTADSERAQRTVARLRASLSAPHDFQAEVGGYPAQVLDLQQAAHEDRLTVMPAVLAIVTLLLLALLRSLLLPLLLICVVLVNFCAALGVSAVIFHLVYGSAATEPSLILFAFVFLVALGVDYNIFLMHRVREESLEAGHRMGTLVGVHITGGVISSAGVVLAATFAALTVMPLRYLAQIGTIVAVGVLLDTLLVRLFVLPALILDGGPRLWWPTRLPPFRDKPLPTPAGPPEKAAV